MPNGAQWIIIGLAIFVLSWFHAGLDREDCTQDVKSHTRMKVECSGFYCERVKAKSLPEICHPFYNDGTGRWAECMGVGRVSPND